MYIATIVHVKSGVLFSGFVCNPLDQRQTCFFATIFQLAVVSAYDGRVPNS